MFQLQCQNRHQAQGQFQIFHKALYQSEAATREERLSLAQKNNINVNDLKQKIPGLSTSKSAQAVKNQIEANIELGGKLNIRATPTFIYGNELFAGAMPKESVLELLDSNKQ